MPQYFAAYDGQRLVLAFSRDDDGPPDNGYDSADLGIDPNDDGFAVWAEKHQWDMTDAEWAFYIGAAA